MAKAAINELSVVDTGVEVLFFSQTAAELKGKYFGESEKNINALFDKARNAAAERAKESGNKVTSIVFLDEVETLAGKRTDDPSGLMTTTVNALLQHMDGIKPMENVTVMAATNYPWRLDSAFLRRFSMSIALTMPSRADIAELINMRITEHFVNSKLDADDRRTGHVVKKGCDPTPTDRKRWLKTKQLIPGIGGGRPLTDLTEDGIRAIADECFKGLYSSSDVDRLVSRVITQLGDTALQAQSFYPTLVNNTLVFQSTLNLDSTNLKKLFNQGLIFAMHNQESMKLLRFSGDDKEEFDQASYNAPWLDYLYTLGF